MPRHGTVSKIFGGRGNGTASKNSPYSQHCGPVPKGPNWPEGPVHQYQIGSKGQYHMTSWPGGPVSQD